MKLTIAYDVSHIQTRRGGIGRFADSLLRELVRVDHVNRYVLHGWSSSLDIETLRGYSSDNVSLNIARIPGTLKRLYWDRLRTVPVNLSTGRFDIFHSTDPFSPPVAGGKVIVTVHDLISGTHPQFYEKKVLSQDTGLGRSIRDSDAVIVPSSFVRDQLMQSGYVTRQPVVIVTPPLAAKFSPVPHPLDADALKAFRLTRPYILFVGTIEPRKNVPGLMHGFESLCRRGNETTDLVLAGKIGWMSENIPAMIEASPFASRIHRLAYVPESTLPALYRNAACFVYPSFLEGYGSPVAEALASGTPVITSHSSGTAEVAGDAAILINPESADEVADAMERLLASDGERNRLHSRGLRRAGELRGHRGAEAVLSLYEQLTRP